MDPEGLANCLIAMGGIANVTVQLGNIDYQKDAKIKAKSLNIQNITNFNQFAFEKNGIRVYRQASIGQGLFIPIKKSVPTFALATFNCTYKNPITKKANTMIEIIKGCP